MPKSGQARVPSPEEKSHLFAEIERHRHPEKNAAIMQISFKLGLRAQEIALLQLKEVCSLEPAKQGVDRGYRVHAVMALPAAYTKGADALGRSRSKYERRTVSFSVEEFCKVLAQVEALAKAGAPIDPETFFPAVKKHKGQSRDLPMVDQDLRRCLERYLDARLKGDPGARPTDPLFLTQKGGPYSPNTLQEHMAFMLRRWAGIEKASSHSGRRALLTDIIHRQRKSLKIAQKIAGHVNASTTLLYEEPPEDVMREALASLEGAGDKTD